MFTLTRRRFLLATAATLLLSTGLFSTAQAASEPDYLGSVPEQVYAGVPFEMPRVPVAKIPDRSVSLTAFGAIGDGKFLNTDAFAQAIRQLSDQGGGRLVVPRGLWLTGPIVLQSNIQLHTEAGAVILFSPDRSLYPLVETEFEGFRSVRCQSPLSAHRAENIAITGQGVIDGSGQAWRPVKRMKMTDAQWRKLVASGGVLEESGATWWPSAGALAGAKAAGTTSLGKRTRAELEAVRDFLRPVMVSIRECRNVLLDGPTFQNSPAWNIHPLLCENLVVRNITVLNPWYSQNGDGLDVESCRNSVVYNSIFDVGDDAICIKSGKDAEGRARGRPTENLVVRNSVVYHGHGGFIVGSEMSGGVRNIYAADLTFIGTDVGIRFKSTRGRGGVVENIHITDVQMLNIPTEPIHFNLFYGGKSPAEEGESEKTEAATQPGRVPEVTEETPAFRNITIRNVVCRGAGTAMWIQGLPEMPVRNVRLENVSITATRGARLVDVEGIQFDRVHVESAEGPVLDLQHAQDVEMHATTVNSPAKSGANLVRVDGARTRSVDLRGVAAPMGAAEFKLGSKLAPDQVRLPAK